MKMTLNESFLHKDVQVWVDGKLQTHVIEICDDYIVRYNTTHHGSLRLDGDELLTEVVEGKVVVMIYSTDDTVSVEPMTPFNNARAAKIFKDNGHTVGWCSLRKKWWFKDND